MREWFARLCWGDTCKRCGLRIGKHRPIKRVTTVTGHRVDRTIKWTEFVCEDELS